MVPIGGGVYPGVARRCYRMLWAAPLLTSKKTEAIEYFALNFALYVLYCDHSSTPTFQHRHFSSDK